MFWPRGTGSQRPLDDSLALTAGRRGERASSQREANTERGAHTGTEHPKNKYSNRHGTLASGAEEVRPEAEVHPAKDFGLYILQSRQVPSIQKMLVSRACVPRLADCISKMLGEPVGFLLHL